MANNQQVIDAHRKHPKWSDIDIAEYLGCGTSYIRATAKRNNLVLLPRKNLYIRGWNNALKTCGETIQTFIVNTNKKPSKDIALRFAKIIGGMKK